MKSDYLQGQVDQIKQQYKAKKEQLYKGTQEEYNRTAESFMLQELDVQNFLAFYTITTIIKEILICLTVSVFAGLLVGGLQSVNALVFLVVAAGYSFLKRNPSQNKEGVITANPNLIEMIQAHIRFKPTKEEHRGQLARLKKECKEKANRIEIDCEAAQKHDIEALKTSYKESLQHEIIRMQATQYPLKLHNVVMPEIQKMLQNQGTIHGILDLSIFVGEDEISVRTSSGLERRFSFVSCNLAQLHDLVKRTVLSTLIAKQAQLEIIKYSPQSTTKVDQNDATCTITITG